LIFCKDSRKEPASRTRSINLALSERGIAALKAAGVMDTILKSMIPMKGRMLHASNSRLTSVPYGVEGQVIHFVTK
jgi:kynurenine 3-monooxygenase